jgi:hypothetical protein
LIKSEFGKTFGGYTNLPWYQKFKSIKGFGLSFLFQLDHNTKHPCTNPEKEIYGHKHRLLYFGNGPDLMIDDSSKQFKTNNGDLGAAYELPKGMV